MSNLESVKPKCKYYSYETFPASVFFAVRETGNYQLMKAKNGTKDAELAYIYSVVFDVRFLKLANKGADRYLELLELLEQKKATIHCFKLILSLHWETPRELWNHPKIVAIRNRHITKLNQYLDVPFNIDGDFDTEMETAMNVSLGIMQNDVTEMTMELDNLKKEASKGVFDFWEELQYIDEWNKQSSNADLLLPQYDAKLKSALAKAEKAKLSQTKAA